MNDDHSYGGRAGRSAAEELLAASAAWDGLAPDRHRHRKDVLMRRIDRDRLAAARQPAESNRRRLLRPVMALPVAAVLTGLLVVTASAGGHTRAPVSAAPQARYNGASVTLGRIADAALAREVPAVRDDQLVYVRNLTRENTGAFGGPVRLGAAHELEYWMVQRPGPVTTEGWMRESGRDAAMPGERIPIVATSPVPAGLDHPTYRWLAALPTDPEALRGLLYAESRSGGSESADETVFRSVGDLLSVTIMPPATAAALYRVVETIPGVTVVPDAVDAAGRHGIGITRKDPGSMTWDEWIFDSSTLAYLGSRHYMTGSTGRGGRVDTLYGVDAVMERGVVAGAGEVPAGTAG